MKRFIIQARLLIAAVVLLASFLGTAGSASAGVNGQQVRISRWGWSGYSYVRVEGVNQHGAYAVWPSYPGGAPAVTTRQWWWKGRVTISYRLTNGTTGVCVGHVPVVQLGDVYDIRCP